MPSRAAGTSTTRATSTTSRSTFTSTPTPLSSRAAPSAGLPIWAAGLSTPTRSTCWAVRSSGCRCSCPREFMPWAMVPLLCLKMAAGRGRRLTCGRAAGCGTRDGPCWRAACTPFSGFSIYNIFFNHFLDVVALFPYMLASLDDAVHRRQKGPLPVLGGAEPCQQLLLLCRAGRLPHPLFLLHGGRAAV